MLLICSTAELKYRGGAAVQKILPYHEMSVSAVNGEKIVRLIECEMGDEFLTSDKELTFIWLFPGTGAFGFDNGTNFMMGNDFMYVNGGRTIKFDDFLSDSKFIMLIVNKEEFVRFFERHSYTFVSSDDVRKLMKITDSDSPYLIHFPASRELIRSVDLVISDFTSVRNPEELVVIDTMRFFNRLANLSKKEYSPLYTASKKEPALYAMKKVREEYRTITLDALAKEMNYSKAYISQTLKNLLDMSFEELLLYRRYIVAMGLLERTDMSLSEIATEVGFETYAGFYKFWKKRHGLSPEEYRKQTRRKTNESIVPSNYTSDYIIPKQP